MPITATTPRTDRRSDANSGTGRLFAADSTPRGIRILFGFMMNHTGYATLADMQQHQFGALYLKGDDITKTLGQQWTDCRARPDLA